MQIRDKIDLMKTHHAITAAEFGLPLEEMLAAKGHAKIEKVTLDDLKLTAIFSKRRKIGAS